MKHVIEVLDELEKNSGSLAKTAILKENEQNELLRRVFALTYDPYVVFYMNKVKVPKPLSESDSISNSDTKLNAFLNALEQQLATRRVTGNAAKKLVVDHLDLMTTVEQKWAMRILLRNLRCGVQAGLINRVWPNTIVPFTVQLAVTLKTSFERGTGIKLLEPVSYPVRVEPKLDGLRCVAVKQNGTVTLYTRNGTVLESLPTIKAFLEEHMPDNTVYDGEGLGSDWNESSSVMMSSKNTKDDSRITFHVFDRLTLTEWREQQTSMSLDDRLTAACDELTVINQGVEQTCVAFIQGETVHNETDLLEFFQQSMDRGFEGIMLKDLDATYAWDRTKSVRKMKPVVTYEGCVTGWYTGREGTKRAGLFAGFYVLLSNGVITRVGGGFKEAEKAQIQLEGPHTWTGKVIECEAQPDPLTVDGLSKDGRMRFPVFIRERSVADVDPKVIEAFERYRNHNAENDA